jgi:hypothetical protein
MNTSPMSRYLKSMTLSLTLSLGALLGGGCGPAEAEAPVAEAQAALNVGACTRAYQTCATRCQRIELHGGDSSQCESDCGAALNSCGCDLAPYQCVFE